MSQIASDRRHSWKTGAPTDDGIRAIKFDIRYAEYKDNSKLREESYVQVEGFFNILRDIERGNPGILSDGDGS